MTGAHHHHHVRRDCVALDPICGMRVNPRTATHRAEHHGHGYAFCSARHRAKFVADPETYLGPSHELADMNAAGFHPSFQPRIWP